MSGKLHAKLKSYKEERVIDFFWTVNNLCHSKHVHVAKNVYLGAIKLWEWKRSKDNVCKLERHTEGHINF